VDLPGEDLSGSFGQVKIVYRELNDSQTSFPAIMDRNLDSVVLPVPWAPLMPIKSGSLAALLQRSISSSRQRNKPVLSVFAISMGQLLGVEKILNKLWIHVG
jgi:hypothetical protein